MKSLLASTTIKISLSILLSALVVSVLSTPTVKAEATAPERRLQIAPLRTELEIEPGTAYTGIVKLKNTGTEKLLVDLSSEAFSVSSETYDYTFAPDSSNSSWIHFSSDIVEIEPGQIRPVQYAVSVPINAEPGGAYISLFGASLPAGNGTIQSTDRVGSLLYITVKGDVTRTGSLLGFSTPLAGFGDTPWSARVHNTGTAHFQTNYTIATKTLWGTTVSEQKDSSMVLPNSIRLLQGNLQPPQWLGLYMIHYDIPIGDGGHAIGTRPYLYLPISQLAALLALTVATVLFLQAAFKNRLKKASDSKPKK